MSTPYPHSSDPADSGAESCVACDLTTGRALLPGGVIARGSGRVVEHCVGPLGVGTLIVKPERHVVHVADLTDHDTMRRHDAHGPNLQAAMFDLNDPPSASSIGEFATRARNLWGRNTIT